MKRVIGIDKSQNEVNYANECLRSFRRKSTSTSESGESGDDDDDEHQKTKNKIEFRIGDGLESVMEENVDVVIFAGMGTLSLSQLSPPAGELVEFREWLWQNKWYIEKESLIIENANAHVVMKCTKKTSEEEKTLSVLDLWLGKLQEEKRAQTLKRTQSTAESTRKNEWAYSKGYKAKDDFETNESSNGTETRTSAQASWLEEEKT